MPFSKFHKPAVTSWILSSIIVCGGCGMQTNTDGLDSANRSQACPVRNISGNVLVQNIQTVREADGSWNNQTGKVKITMLFSTLSPRDGTLTIVQQMSPTCAGAEHLVRGNTVPALAAVPQGGANCQAAAIALNDPTCLN